MEIWKDIKSYEGRYKISNHGNVFSLKHNKVFKNNANGKGYVVVTLCDGVKEKSHSVHRLVATHFIDNYNNLPEVNHKDEIKTNNNVDNLEWCTRKYNSNYTNLPKRIAEKQSKKCCCTNIKTGIVINFNSIAEARRNGFNASSIFLCLKGVKDSISGYSWSYC